MYCAAPEMYTFRLMNDARVALPILMLQVRGMFVILIHQPLTALQGKKLGQRHGRVVRYGVGYFGHPSPFFASLDILRYL